MRLPRLNGDFSRLRGELDILRDRAQAGVIAAELAMGD